MLATAQSTVYAAIIAALVILVGGLSFLYLRRRMQEIHVLVNRRLELALKEIEELKEDRHRTALKQHGSAPVKPSDAGRADDG